MTSDTKLGVKGSKLNANYLFASDGITVNYGTFCWITGDPTR